MIHRGGGGRRDWHRLGEQWDRPDPVALERTDRSAARVCPFLTARDFPGHDKSLMGQTTGRNRSMTDDSCLGVLGVLRTLVSRRKSTARGRKGDASRRKRGKPGN